MKEVAREVGFGSKMGSRVWHKDEGKRGEEKVLSSQLHGFFGGPF